MLYVNQDEKKVYMPFLRERVDKIKEHLPYPSYYWQFDIASQLKDYLKNLDEKYTNICKQKQKGIFFNKIKSSDDDPNMVEFISEEDYWTTVPIIDVLYDLFLFEENNQDVDDSNNPIRSRIYKGLHESLRSGISNMEDMESYYKKHTMKPGKFLKKLFPEASPQEAEEFQQKWFRHYSQWGWDAVEIVSDIDIIKYYYKDNYYEHEGTLGASCMRGARKMPLIHFYRNNNIRMAIFKNPDTDLIRARALIWNVTIPEDMQKKYNLPENMDFLDRPYFITEKDKLILQQFGKKNGMLVKSKPSPGWVGVYTPDGTFISENLKFYVKLDIIHDGIPYLDTLNHITKKNDEYYLTSKETGLEATSTDGSTLTSKNEGYIYDKDKDRYILKNDAMICDKCYRLIDGANEKEAQKHENCERR